ncbi:MAG: FMN-binding glutamate synthase family protein [Verrucomicrobia bacterium]|jgi:glutamate synthase domain-containing protein 2|nr:FMN-binding glutamate synthase family protein [Verrucomicrobiota bacterium]
MTWIWIILVILVLVLVYDLCQKKHAILRNFPIVGHFRYILEAIGPELRQYIVTDNDEERPFSRDQRRWVYATSKKQNDYFGFGTDNDLEQTPNYIFIKHSPFPLNRPASSPDYPIPCAKVLGQHRGRKNAFRMPSVVNVSAMSFGSLSSAAVEAINRGCALTGALHNTGEGGVSKHHLHGADLIWQIGTGYFGCRNGEGGFDLSAFRDMVQKHPQIRAIEIKLSQGAKAGLGGIVPAQKVTPEIAAIRGVEPGKACLSPPSHSAFSDADSLLDFAELLAETSGLPVGIKSAVGQMEFWEQLAIEMATGSRGLDFVTIDGGEGGTGAAPLVFSDHVALPFKQAFSRVFLKFDEQHLTDKLVFLGSGKLGFPETAMTAFALGCDGISVGREAMLAIGCIQAQRCHTGHCPAGVATQNAWLMRGLEPTQKSARLANYVRVLRKEILRVCHASGVPHPALMDSKHVELSDGQLGLRTLDSIYGYPEGLRQCSPEWSSSIQQLMGETFPTTGN